MHSNDFINHEKDIRQKEGEYGIYNDLLAKFYLTEADIALEGFEQRVYPKPEEIHTALENYALAMRHAQRHNQERYLVILGAFSARVRLALEHLSKQNYGVQKLAQYVESFFSTDPIYIEDSTFSLFLNALLSSMALKYTHLGGSFQEDAVKPVKRQIRQLVEKSKFVKAALVNENLIGYCLENKQNEKAQHELLIRYFQQYTNYLSSSQNPKAETVATDLKDFLIDDNQTSLVLTLKNGISALMEGTLAYRKGDLWNMEKFILGELEYHREGKEDSLKDAETLLLEAVKIFSQLISPQNSTNALTTGGGAYPLKVYRKLYSEALLRLGELYILLEEKRECSWESDIKDYISQHLQKVFENKLVKTILEELKTPACFSLLKAAYQAALANDEQREADALQSVVNALYFQSYTQNDSDSVQEKAIQTLQKIHEYIRERLLKQKEGQKYRFPLIASKTYLVEGDLYFSWLFERKLTSETPLLSYKLRRSENNSDRVEDKNYLNDPNMQKSILHKMKYNYIAGLNQLTDANKKYESYHFNNMLLEINRRMLFIEERELTRYLSDDLRVIWDSFPNLVGKQEILETLDFSHRIHEVALASKEIFRKKTEQLKDKQSEQNETDRND